MNDNRVEIVRRNAGRVPVRKLVFLDYRRRSDATMGVDAFDTKDESMVCVDITVGEAEQIVRHLNNFIAHHNTEAVEVPVRHVEQVKAFLDSLS